MATVEQVIQGLERQLGLYKEAVGQRDGLLRTAYGQITALTEELAKYKTAVTERDARLTEAYAEIRALVQQVSEAGKRIADIGGPAAPPERSATPEAAGGSAEPPAPPTRDP